MTVEDIVKRIQSTVVLKGIRINEFFKDFDRLRSGKVTQTQFVRCIGQVGIYLSPKDVKNIYKKYGAGTDTIGYREFVDDIDSVFTTKGLELMPTLHVHHAQDLVKPELFHFTDPDQESVYVEARDQLARHCHLFGLSIKTIYFGFDYTNNGWVTRSQFERNLPVPPEFPENLKWLIVDRFTRDGLCNYAALHKEVEGHRSEDPLTYRHTLKKPELVEHATITATSTTDYNDLMKALQLTFLKTHVRPLEYFRDYDKLRTSLITKNQFECGISLACSAPGGLRLSRAQVQVLVDNYKTDEDKIKYRQFCTEVDNMLYTGKADDLVSDPLAEIPKIKAKDFTVNALILPDEEEEGRAQELLANITKRVDQRGLDLYPHFRDFDRRSGFTKGVTWPQFQRLLDLTLGMDLSENDVVLLCKKYNNPATGHINYVRFIGDVDDLVNIPTIGDDEELYGRTLARKDFKTLNEIAPADEMSNVDKTLKKIKHYVVEKSLRVMEALRDFDPLRKGFITPGQFTRGLSTLAPHLTGGELKAVAHAYTSANAPLPTTIDWRRFVKDMDHMHVPSHKLESTPTIDLHDFDAIRRQVANDNAMSLEDKGLSEEDREVLDICLESIRDQALQLRLSLGDPFFAADPIRRGKLPPEKFARCLDMTKANVFPEDIELLQKYYSLANGEVDYASFLRDVVPPQKEESLVEQTIENMKQTLQIRQARLEDEDGGDVEEVLYRIKIQVVDRRIRLEEHFRGFDRLRKGYISKPNFRSAISMCNIGLTPAEYAAMEVKYAVDDMPDKFNYNAFTKDVNHAFGTVDLHLNPTKEPEKYKAPTNIEIDAHLRNETAEQVKMREDFLRQIAQKTRLRGISLIDDLEDYDKFHNGTVTISQFQRVLSDVGLFDVSIPEQQFKALCHKYLVGLRDVAEPKLHYKSFLVDVDNLEDLLHQESSKSSWNKIIAEE
eukprot:m.137217 g.137217  ORF g.137217 m.137217 type:complete len:950 (+) comp11451_c0_seq1:201-3050(+)